jgi:pimeloyl-ACP methyl ester carboxylesterase
MVDLWHSQKSGRVATMPEPTTNDQTSHIEPLILNGMHGRVVHLPSLNPNSKRDTLFIYGQHSSIERWWGLIQALSHYGSVTAPDLPGFGGMDSMYKVGKEPTFDELADYLADFVRHYYEGKSFNVMGLSIGFAVVTRMLERHPELTKQVNLLVSVVGFAHHDDFVFSKNRLKFYVYGSKFFSVRPFHLILKYVFYNPVLLRLAYHRSFNAKEKFEGMTGDDFKRTMDMEITLWKVNDLRTWLRNNIEMFKLDNCRTKVNLPVLHLSVRKDRYFDLGRVEGHYRQIFSDYDHIQLPTDSHGPSVIATPEEAMVLVPVPLQELLSK